LLDWHLRRGTRPGGRIDHPGRQWGVKEFGSAVGLGDRTIRYWLHDQHLPPEIETIERVLFGRDARYAEWRLELRRARATSQGGKGHGAPALTVKGLPASNIPIRVPTHFMGRDEALLDIEAALKRDQGRVAITALHGLRGVGKTTLAAAYADRHRGDYQATWWIRAQTEASMRADLVALGIRLGWVGVDDKEEPALAAVIERLCHEGEGILLIFDNATGADALKPYLPRGGSARVLVTSNAHAWRGVAAPVEIRQWPKEIGADYLIARTGRAAERTMAETLSGALGGLPLAHEQAAAYCERLDVSLDEYRRRFETTPAQFLDDARHAPAEYHDGLTVAKTFTLAIEEAARLHPSAEPLIVHAALLAPEPIPLFLFAEALDKLGEPLASTLADDGIDEALAALRTFALIDRETIVDDRDATITTDSIRLHRLLRQVAASRREGESRDRLRHALVAALAAVYPPDSWDNPISWPRCAALTPHLLSMCETEMTNAAASAICVGLLNRAGGYFYGRAAYSGARPLFERALAICEKVLGPEHPDTAASLNSLARVLRTQGDLAGARPLAERALAIRENVLGPKHYDTAWSLTNVARLLQAQGDLAGARPFYERALAIRENVLGPEHPEMAMGLSNLAEVLRDQGDFAGARPLAERALAIGRKALGPEHPDTALSLNNLASLLRDQGDFAGARPLFEDALAICEKVLGPEHPQTALSLNNLGLLLQDQDDLAGARPLFMRALAIRAKVFGPEHPHTALSLNNLALLLQDQGDLAGARPLCERALAIMEKIFGSEHPATAWSLISFGRLLQASGDFHAARHLLERALAFFKKTLAHRDTDIARYLLAGVVLGQGNAVEALRDSETALAGLERALGKNSRWTKDAARTTADALDALGRAEEAATFRARYRIEPGQSQN
jgi:tetratricopeptide (TPR) repeat protein